MKAIRTIFAFLLTVTIIAPRGVTVLLLSDADSDGEVCITDATMIQRNVAKITIIEDDCRRSADVDNDGIITIMDATIIQRWLAQISVSYPIGTPLKNSSIQTEENHSATVFNSTEKPTTTPTEITTQTPSVISTNATIMFQQKEASRTYVRINCNRKRTRERIRSSGILLSDALTYISINLTIQLLVLCCEVIISQSKFICQ